MKTPVVRIGVALLLLFGAVALTSASSTVHRNATAQPPRLGVQSGLYEFQLPNTLETILVIPAGYRFILTDFWPQNLSADQDAYVQRAGSGTAQKIIHNNRILRSGFVFDEGDAFMAHSYGTIDTVAWSGILEEK
ncbi:MAG: hypothetical protein EYC70_07040 [Planctomycetota bacterium]|nr:MAG: hypothetical protein EYC70_07040 [Planctomycetota bacterium]